ncbi:MAG TPA: metallophosphoesterase family protein [Anaerolineae bacterium]|nr:metallophosphoesterase family protein [Anaerolineae bacterium]
MRVLVISDIHANLTAFETVLADAEGEWEMIWCLGDVIGYGPDPNECVALLREQNHMSLSGNHDWAVLDKLDTRVFNDDAKRAIAWAQSVLTDETRAYLDSLPARVDDQHPAFTLAHGSPREPVWEYILDSLTALANFDLIETPLCLVGHSHVAGLFERMGATRVVPRSPIYRRPITLVDKEMILNPGSVGQPRDSDPRAAYALLDTDEMTWEFRRVAYAIEETQARMTAHGLPERLVQRLNYGW